MKERKRMMGMDENNIKWLTTVPAADGNFKSRLRTAADGEIREAVSIMEGNGRKGNVSRIEACSRELRKREKEIRYE